MKKLLVVGIIVISVFSYGFVQSNDYKLDSLTIEDGLTCNGISSILKDKQGRMWFGTYTGLTCFDGYNFKNYKSDFTNQEILSNNEVNDICEDRDENLWIATRNGLNKFYLNKEIFIHYFSNPNDSTTLSSNYITTVFVDNSGTLWVGTNDAGLNRFDRESKSFHRYKNDPDDPKSLSGNRINVIYEDLEGTIWIGTSSGGLNMYDKDNDNLHCFPLDTRNISGMSNFITDICEDKLGRFWVCTRDGLYLFDREKEKFTRYLYEVNDPDRLENQAIVAFLEDNSGNYWLKTFGGLYLYNSTFKKLNKWQYTRDREFHNLWWFSRLLYQDECGTLWYNHYWENIYKLSIQNKKFRRLPAAPANNLLKNVWDIYVENENIIWMGTIGGLIRFNRKNNNYKVYQPNPGDMESISNNIIHDVHKDRNGFLWVCLTNGLAKVEILKNDEVQFINYYPYPGKSENKKIGSAFKIFEDRAGRLFITYESYQTYIFDTERERFFQLINTLGNSNIIGHILFEEETGEYWASVKGAGLLKIFPPFEKITSNKVAPLKIIRFKEDVKNPGSLNGTEVTACLKDQSGTKWFSSDKGLNKLIVEKNEHTSEFSEQFVHYTTQDGLPFDIISSILEDEHGNLWMGSENGLTKFNPSTEIFKNYDKSDGLWTLDISRGSYCSPSGEMFFATNEEVLAFHPDSIKDNPHVPPVVITDFRLFNKPVDIDENSPLKKSVTVTEEIVLPFNQNTLSFEYAALNYINTHKNQYKYMMEGLDKEWIDAGTRRHAEYHGLNPGKYTFRVIGSNNDGIWNMEGASLKITILPPWWRTVYAYTGYSILILLAVLGYIQLRTQKLKKEKIVLEKKVKERTQKIEEHEREIVAQKELVEERNKQIEQKNKQITELDRLKTRFFTNVSHEFRTPLTLIQSPVEDLMENERLSVKVHKKLDMVYRNARRLLSLVNQLLDISKIDSGKMKLKLFEGDVFKTLQVITGSFLSLAEAKGIVYNRHIPKIEKQTWYDAESLEKIVVNLLSNAFKFSPEAGEVTFEARLVDDVSLPGEILEFSVSDQGSGIPAELQGKIFDRFYQDESSVSKTGAGTGIGLSLTRDLVKLNHGEITVQSEPGKGSTFTVRFPLGKEHLNKNEYVIIETREEKVFPEPELLNGSEEIVEPAHKETLAENYTKKPIILIVEDNPDIRTHIRNNFEDEYRVMEAIDGSAGLKKALDTIPDLVITDLMMPRMDGMELCKQLKSDERTSHIPVVMLTAKATLEDKLEGLETGADDYIAKPFQVKELKARVSNLIEQRKKLRERFSREITLEPGEVTVNSYDEEFLKRAIGIVEARMSDENFDMDAFQKELNMSHSTLYRKLFSLTNQSPTGFIRSIRIKRGAQLIRQHYGNIAKVSYEVGFNNPSYFSKCFKEIIGVSPVEYSKN